LIDINLLLDSEDFSVSERARVAFVHHGFARTLAAEGQEHRAHYASKYPPLGLLSLIRQLEVNYADFDEEYRPYLEYFDEDEFEDDDAFFEAVFCWLAKGSFRILAVGVYTASFERVSQFLGRFPEDQVCRVVGGPHATAAPAMPEAHIAVRGEGGRALYHIIEHLLRPTFGDGPDAAGLCYQERGKVVISKPAFDRSLAEIPSPAYDYGRCPVPPRANWVRTVGHYQQIYVATQSCGARCTFCSTYLIHGRFVSRPVRLIEQDLRLMRDRYGYDSIEFHDDDLLQHDDFSELLELLTELGLSWSCNARADTSSSQTALRMQAAGCRSVFLGLESLDETTLKYFRKGCSVKDNLAAVAAFHDAGIAIISGFIIGAPHHTLEGVLAEIDAFKALPIFYLTPSILTPDFGTVEFQRAKAKDSRFKALEIDRTSLSVRPRPDLFGSLPPYGLPTVCERLTKVELNDLAQLAQVEFFLNDSAIARILQYTPIELHEIALRWLEGVVNAAKDLQSRAVLPVIRQRAFERLANFKGIP